MAQRHFAISGGVLIWVLILIAAALLGLLLPYLLPDVSGEEPHVLYNSIYAGVLICLPVLLPRLGLPLKGWTGRWHAGFVAAVSVASYLLLDFAYFQTAVSQWLIQGLDDIVFVFVTWTILHLLLIGKTVQIGAGLLMGVSVAPAEVVPPKPEPDALRDMAEDRRWLTRDLYRRSDAMRARANLILLAIIALILGGLVSIYVAGDLVSGDAQTVTRLEQLTQTIDNVEQELEAKDTQLAQLAAQEASLQVAARDLRRVIFDLTGDQSPGLWEISKEIEPEEARILEGGSVVAPPTDRTDEEMRELMIVRREEFQIIEGEREELVSNYREVETRRQNEKARRADIARALSALEQNLSSNIDSYLVSAQREPSDVSLLLASGITRFGILLVVIFLVQILVGVYRYSLRLSAFYAGRADALVAAKDRKTDLGAWEAAFTPMDIDFGRQPVTPAQYVVDIVRAYMTKDKKAKAKAAEADPAQI
ncbi:MAG: hypothetical protein AAF601_11555 [Pseudomonadota bacterium]